MLAHLACYTILKHENFWTKPLCSVLRLSIFCCFQIDFVFVRSAKLSQCCLGPQKFFQRLNQHRVQGTFTVNVKRFDNLNLDVMEFLAVINCIYGNLHQFANKKWTWEFSHQFWVYGLNHSQKCNQTLGLHLFYQSVAFSTFNWTWSLKRKDDCNDCLILSYAFVLTTTNNCTQRFEIKCAIKQHSHCAYINVNRLTSCANVYAVDCSAV